MATIDYKEKYEQALERAVKLRDDLLKNGTLATAKGVESIFPELVESEDERMKEAIIATIHLYYGEPLEDEAKEMIAWLEKQGEQPKKHDVCDNCDQQGSCVSPCPMKLVENQGEQEHVVVIPKFRVGDVIRPKGSTAEYTIESIFGECYHGKGWGLHISCDNDYELVEQKPVEWSEEDDSKLKEVLYYVEYVNKTNVTFQQRDLTYLINWLKSLRPRSYWKPSDEQMKQLGWVAEQNKDNMIGKELMTLYNDLKKLMEE